MAGEVELDFAKVEAVLLQAAETAARSAYPHDDVRAGKLRARLEHRLRRVLEPRLRRLSNGNLLLSPEALLELLAEAGLQGEDAD